MIEGKYTSIKLTFVKALDTDEILAEIILNLKISADIYTAAFFVDCRIYPEAMYQDTLPDYCFASWFYSYQEKKIERYWKFFLPGSSKLLAENDPISQYAIQGPDDIKELHVLAIKQTNM